MASYHRNTNLGVVHRRPKPHSSHGGSSSFFTGTRPRSLGLFSAGSSASIGGYGGMLGLSTGAGGYKSSPYLSRSPSVSMSTYGGTSSGYGGLTLNTPSSSSLSLSSSPTSSYYNSFLPKSGGGYSSGGYHNGGYSGSGYGGSGYGGAGYGSSSRNSGLLPIRTSSFNRTKSIPRSLPLTLGSRSGSMSSLATVGSEGYASGNDASSGHSSRLGSSAGDSPAHSRAITPANSVKDGNENGELDYKKLYETAMGENERLREKLKKTEDGLSDAKSHAEKVSATSSGKTSMSEIEKRERRAMERKLSEMEEELKLLEQFKLENQRLKDENGALIRVISKLSK